MRRGWIALSLAAAAVAIAALPALAARSSSSISLVVPAAAATAGTTSTSGAHYGQQVTFSVSTSATSYPWVDTKCSQNGTVVYEQWAGFFSSYNGSDMFTLGPTQLWSGGAASCTATLVSFDKNGKASTLASTGFSVSG